MCEHRKHRLDNNFTWTDGVHLNARAREFARQFIGKHDVSRLGVLVRLKTVERSFVEEKQILCVQRLQICADIQVIHSVVNKNLTLKAKDQGQGQQHKQYTDAVYRRRGVVGNMLVSK